MRFRDISNLFPLNALQFLSSLPCTAGCLDGHQWERDRADAPWPSYPQCHIGKVHFFCQLLLFTHLTTVKDSSSSGTGSKRAVGRFCPSLRSCLPPHQIAPTLLLVCEGPCQRNLLDLQLQAAQSLCDPCPVHLCNKPCEMCPSLQPLRWAFEHPLNTQLKVFVWERERNRQN